MSIDKVGGSSPFHGRVESSKSPEDQALAKAVLRRRKAPESLNFTAAPRANARVNHLAQIIFGRNG